MKKYDILPALFWIGLSIFAMIGAYKLDLGEFHDRYRLNCDALAAQGRSAT